MKENRFIERPVLAICISIAIVFLGFLALFSLSIEKFPDIAPPTVHVSATYMGASAETVQKAVIVPLEEAINGVEHMTYMESSASSGSASINIYFKQGTDPDQAAVNVQNKVSEAQGQLPSEVTKIGVTVEKRQISTLAMVGLYSPDDSFDETFITNYIDINIAPQIQRIEGVGEVRCMGATYSMRIWLNPEVMAHYGLVPSDITAVLDEQNIETSTGSFGENSDNVFTYTMKYRGRYQTPEEFGELVVRSTADGEVLRLKDIARIELGNEDYSYIGGLNGHPGVTMMINQTAGSNATEINLKIEALLEELSESFPAGLEYLYLQNTNDFLFASISEVIKTLIEAILLVVLVVFFFLHDYKLTLIPTLSLIVSLVGSFAVIYLLGFSLNLLTLFALILVIGTVVDDAIVVVEAVQAKMDEGEENAAEATVSAMHDITAAVITSTVVFMAVFIPISFMSGTSGIFYRQFGLTMAVAVAISMVNALTLSPALSALLLQHKTPDRKFKTWVKQVYETSYKALSHKYEAGLRIFLRRKWIAGAAILCAGILSVLLMNHTKTGLIPSEDTGTLFVSVSTAPGSNTRFTNSILDKIEEVVRTYPEIKAYSRIVGHSMTGGSGSTSGMLVLQLHDWNDRKGHEHSSTALMERLNRDMRGVTDAEVFVMAPSMIDGYGTGNAVELYLQDRKGGEIRDFYDITQNFLTALNARPEVMSAFSSFKVDYVQYVVDVDAAKCKRAGISPTDVLDVISGYYGGIYASNIIRFSKVYRVIIQADPAYRLDPNSLDNIYFRNGGEMAPVSQFVTLEKVYGPEGLNRFNLFNSISANVTMADGYSSGDVIAAIAEVARETLPEGYGYEFGSSSREESGSDNTIYILIVCVVFIYLLLSSLYESFFVPLAVILSVPFGILGCFAAANLFGVENNIYLQTGMIMIIGLLAKTAILITEYAAQRRQAGMSIEEAAFDAARVRLRPILMTFLTLVFGMLPLLYASGASANGNRTLGAGVVGGMLIGTIALLFFVPPLFIIMQRLQERFGFIIIRKKKFQS
ncbi:efflux RND transporter permease subunit [Alistipes sp.]|uniref:efflux RND transporter permease subunit n=1 Tax=Alistipes sp. TaxID=1872444 RepID=UPI0025BAA186|nr:efflux RND transporter permease subunit [Alistipes sp.]